MTQPPTGVPTCYRHPDRESHIRCQRCGRPICPDCMNDASVGYHCPECLAEGRKSARTPHAAYGGQVSTNPAATSIGLIVLNAAVWVGILVTGWRSSPLIDRLALIPLGICRSDAQGDRFYPAVGSEQVCESAATQGDGVWFAGVADGAYWQLITNAFAHVQPWHIGVNMLVLWFIGPQLERVLGRTRYLALYLVSALAASVCVYWLAEPTSATLGASGAIFGLLGAYLVVALKVGGDVQTIVIWLAINAVITFTVPNVSWQGHLGGFVGGAIISAILVYAPRGDRRALIQYAGIAALVVVLAAATVARTLVLA